MTNPPLRPDFQEATNELLYDLQDDSINSAPLPKHIFHYTDAAGLIGSLSSGTIWATDFRFLNDSSELAYTFDLAKDLVRTEFLGRFTPGVRAAFLANAGGDAPPIYTKETPYYLTCFTELENSLSQWRAYSGAQGYSLEFPGDLTSIAGYDPEGRQNPGATLLRVEYDREVQEAYIRGLVNRILGICDAPHLRQHPKPEDAIRSFAPFYWAQLERVSYRFKHPDFADEREWRLVSWGDVHREEYRTGRLGIIPYIDRSLHSAEAARRGTQESVAVPLTSVRYGPTQDQRLALRVGPCPQTAWILARSLSTPRKLDAGTSLTWIRRPSSTSLDACDCRILLSTHQGAASRPKRRLRAALARRPRLRS